MLESTTEVGSSEDSSLVKKIPVDTSFLRFGSVDHPVQGHQSMVREDQIAVSSNKGLPLNSGFSLLNTASGFGFRYPESFRFFEIVSYSQPLEQTVSGTDGDCF